MLDEISLPLFVPANRPERFAKAASSGADAVILDLEDAVAPAEKEAARGNLSASFSPVPVLVRVNSTRTALWEDDVAAARQAGAMAVIIPKAEDDAAFASAREAAGLPVFALVETAQGVADCRRLARLPTVRRLVFGSIDYCADIGCAHTREALLAARSEIVLASRLAGLSPAIDGVTVALDNAEACRNDARYACDLGFGGKLLIHPRQVESARRGLTPSEAEVDWANAVLAAGNDAVSIQGAMVDLPVRLRAQALLRRANLRSDRQE